MPMTLRSMKHTLSFCVITFMLKYLKSTYFSNKMMDLVNIWYDVRYQSKVSEVLSVCLFIHSSICPPVHQALKCHKRGLIFHKS